jgi:hypothetical protein
MTSKVGKPSSMKDRHPIITVVIAFIGAAPVKIEAVKP